MMADAGGDARARRRDLVRRGYDTISRAYRDDEGRANPGSDEGTDRYEGWVDDLAKLIRPRARVLDLGCGAGVPATKLLTDRNFDVLGVDISAVQIARARQLVPEPIRVGDMVTWQRAARLMPWCRLRTDPLPLADQQDLLAKIRLWLRRLATTRDRWCGAGRGSRITRVADVLGPRGSNRIWSWLKAADLAPVWDRFVPEGNAGHTLVLAQAT